MQFQMTQHTENGLFRRYMKHQVSNYPKITFVPKPRLQVNPSAVLCISSTDCAFQHTQLSNSPFCNL